MKQAILSFLCLAVVASSHAQNNSIKIIAANGHKVSVADSILASIPDTEKLFQDVLNVTGLRSNFTLKEADVLNIEASISRKQRYVLYNPSFIGKINKLTRSKWATLTLLAHEIGHHLNGHTLHKGGSAPQLELEADEFAGYVLYKLGATLEQAQLVMNYIAKPVASSTHPSRQDRFKAISKGWHKEINSSQQLATP